MSTILNVVDVTKSFQRKAKPAVDNISFSVDKGKTLGLVGESGSGKSTTAKMILRLLSPDCGAIEFEGKNIFHMSKHELTQYHKDVQMIFQDPYTAIDPVWPIYKALEEAMTIQKLYEKGERKERAVAILKKVGIDRWNAFPRELSGGQIQRACIAKAIVLQPKMLVCDEATSALDASVKAQIVNLLLELQEEYDLSYLFITHDLAMLKHLADEVAVMQNGCIVEYAKSEKIYEAPEHIYTRELLLAAANVPL